MAFGTVAPYRAAAPLRAVVFSKHAHMSVLDILECGHRQYAPYRQDVALTTATHRRCKACQANLGPERREAVTFFEPGPEGPLLEMLQIDRRGKRLSDVPTPVQALPTGALYRVTPDDRPRCFGRELEGVPDRERLAFLNGPYVVVVNGEHRTWHNERAVETWIDRDAFSIGADGESVAGWRVSGGELVWCDPLPPPER